MNMAAVAEVMVRCVMLSDRTTLITSPGFRARWKQAMFDLFHRQQFTHAITLVWNGKVPRARMREDLRRFHRRVDKAILGSRCEHYPKASRSRALFVIEGVEEGHSHVHSYWRFPHGKLLAFNRLFPGQRGGLWNKLIRRGTYKVAMVSPTCRNDEFTGYLLKRQHEHSDAEDIIWSDEFLPDR